MVLQELCKKPYYWSRLVAVNRQSNPYFRSSPKSHERKSCVYVPTMQKKSETYRAAIFIQDMLEWLNDEESNDERRLTLNIRSNFSHLKSTDLIITHNTNDDVTWKETHIMVVDKNRKRKSDPQIKSLTLDISRWNDTQLTQFDDAGVRKFSELGKLIQREKLGSVKKKIEFNRCLTKQNLRQKRKV